MIRTLFDAVLLLPADHRWLRPAPAIKDSGPMIDGGYYPIPILAADAVEDGPLDRVLIRKTALTTGNDALPS